MGERTEKEGDFLTLCLELLQKQRGTCPPGHCTASHWLARRANAENPGKTAGKPERAARSTDCSAQPISGFRYHKKSAKSRFLRGFPREIGPPLGIAIPIIRGESGRQTREPVSFHYAMGSVFHTPPLHSRPTPEKMRRNTR